MTQSRIDPVLVSLPIQPVIASQINKEYSQETFTAKSLGAIISKDTALATKVLKLANSSYYGLSRQVDTVERAVTILGINTIKNVATSLSLASIFHQTGPTLFDSKGLWHHSLGCAVVVKNLLAVKNQELVEMGFLCGIMHDMGKIALFQQMPKQMQEVFRQMRETGKDQFEAETSILGFNHPKVGAMMTESWHFPPVYARAVNNHHDPPHLSGGDDQTGATLATATYLGNKIAKMLHRGSITDPTVSVIEQEALEALGVAPPDLPVLLKNIKNDYQLISESLES
jgi:HD-like signal output (HDOD) protein